MGQGTFDSFADLLALFTAKDNDHQRQKFVSLNKRIKDIYYLNYVSNLLACDINREDFEGEASLVLVIKLLWKLVPIELFKCSDPDYENLAYISLKSEFGSSLPNSVVSNLSTIFRRLRQFRLNTFRQSSLNLENPIHKEILNKQNHSCAVCFFRFPNLESLALDDPDLSLEDHYLAKTNEIVLNKYYRKPQLDHIIPFYLGGDGKENWQILCQTCNAGKSDSIAWLSRKTWMPPLRISDALELTPSLRYSILASYRMDNTNVKNTQNGILRIFKKNAQKLVFFENLLVRRM